MNYFHLSTQSNEFACDYVLVQGDVAVRLNRLLSCFREDQFEEFSFDLNERNARLLVKGDVKIPSKTVPAVRDGTPRYLYTRLILACCARYSPHSCCRMSDT